LTKRKDWYTGGGGGKRAGAEVADLKRRKLLKAQTLKKKNSGRVDFEKRGGGGCDGGVLVGELDW